MKPRDNPRETRTQRLERLKKALSATRERLESLPPGRGLGLALEIYNLERRIRIEETHALSGYHRRNPHPVAGGAPGSNRRK